ncbi:MAG: glycoside hydrolase family 130 protein [Deltaproteobacteria bacterium]|nr:glycoside hydrolase family 130 protein [Deltaproteobacteria bacterium]
MPRKKQHDIIHRWEGNPVITMEDLPFKASNICNAGAVRIENTYLLLVTIETLRGHKKLYIARSEDGRYFDMDAKPFMESAGKKYEEISVMDGRITPFEDTYYISYIAESHYGYRIGLARTDDFKTVTRLGFVSEVDIKDGTLFPEKVNGRFARLERPWAGGNIWISYSDDLVYWGGSEIVLSHRPGHWDTNRVGNAAPPFKVKDGRWLLLYYGIKDTSAGPLFRIGAVFLDPDNPAKVLSRTNIPILSPRERYERVGDIPNLIFSCGAILEDEKLLLYYGASNSCICLGSTTIDKIDHECLKSKGDA